jgi:8-oxo-dGTP pyrophosphatase MutT (NUDIX family)
VSSQEENPFQVRSKRDVYENAWIRVTENEVIRPDGKPGVYGVVHFKNRAVGVIAYEDGKLWLVGQHRFPLDLYSWEIPEGGSPEGETLEETARRELAEETGLRARRLERIVELHLSNSVTDEYGVVFLARDLTPGEARPEGTERLSLAEVTLEEAYRRVTEGEITDSLSVAGILRLRLLQLEGRL